MRGAGLTFHGAPDVGLTVRGMLAGGPTLFLKLENGQGILCKEQCLIKSIKRQTV